MSVVLVLDDRWTMPPVACIEMVLPSLHHAMTVANWWVGQGVIEELGMSGRWATLYEEVKGYDTLIGVQTG